MIVNKSIFSLLLILLIGGCELIVIGSKAKPVVAIDRTSPVGTVYLFKTELDSNNVAAATEILARPNGTEYLALEQYELYNEVARIGRIIRDLPVTDVKTDSLKPDLYRVNIEFDYIRPMKFSTLLINNDWYIVQYEE